MGDVQNVRMDTFNFGRQMGNDPEPDKGQSYVYVPGCSDPVGVAESASWHTSGDGLTVWGMLTDGRRFVVYPNGAALVDLPEGESAESIGRRPSPRRRSSSA